MDSRINLIQSNHLKGDNHLLNSCFQTSSQLGFILTHELVVLDINSAVTQFFSGMKLNLGVETLVSFLHRYNCTYPEFNAQMPVNTSGLLLPSTFFIYRGASYRLNWLLFPAPKEYVGAAWLLTAKPSIVSEGEKLSQSNNNSTDALSSAVDHHVAFHISSLFDERNIGLAWKDRRGVYTGCNKSFAQLFKSPHCEIKGKTDKSLGFSDDQLKYLQQFDKGLWNRVLGANATCLKLCCEDGSTKNIRIQAFTYYGIAQQPMYIIYLVSEYCIQGHFMANKTETTDDQLHLSNQVEKHLHHRLQALSSMLSDATEKDKDATQLRCYIKAIQTEIKEIQVINTVVSDVMAKARDHFKPANNLVNLESLMEAIHQDCIQHVLAKPVNVSMQYIQTNASILQNNYLIDKNRVEMLLSGMLRLCINFLFEGSIDISFSKQQDAAFFLVSLACAGCSAQGENIAEFLSIANKDAVLNKQSSSIPYLWYNIYKYVLRAIGGKLHLDIQKEVVVMTLSVPISQQSKDFNGEEIAVRPLVANMGSVHDATDQTLALQAASYAQNNSEHKLSILLIEDNKVNQKVMMQLLTEFNCSIDIVESAREAKVAFNVNGYDLIFMDIGLPDNSGLCLARDFRHSEKSRSQARTPICVITAELSFEYQNGNANDGTLVDATVFKPVSSQLLEQAIRKCLTDYPYVSNA